MKDLILPSDKKVTSIFRNLSQVSDYEFLEESGERKFVGPISRKMYESVKKLDSNYKDSFDWTIYDQIHDRFGKNQPRGGVVFKTNLKLVNHHSTCTRCHYAFEIDTYGRGCIHNCVYCYAKESLTQHGYWNRPMPFPIDLADIRKTFYEVFETQKDNKWRSVLESRTPLRIGSMSDSFMYMDRKYGVTKELLRILKHYSYPSVIFTRSDLVAEDEYLSLLDPNHTSVQFSICGIDENMTRLIEPGAPSVIRRFKALKKLNENGIRTAVRINPLFPTYPDGYFTDKAYIISKYGNLENVPRLSFFNIDSVGEFLDLVKESQTPTVLAGFVRLSRYANAAIKEATQVNIKDFFRSDIPQDARDKRYTDSEIAHYYSVIHKESLKRGIRFSTCYIGNGVKDYFQYQKIWSNKSDCCDLKGVLPAFSRTSQDVDWDIRIKHAANKIDAQKARTLDLEKLTVFMIPNEQLGKAIQNEVNP